MDREQIVSGLLKVMDVISPHTTGPLGSALRILTAAGRLAHGALVRYHDKTDEEIVAAITRAKLIDTSEEDAEVDRLVEAKPRRDEGG